jgi:hypothetical protein
MGRCTPTVMLGSRQPIVADYVYHMLPPRCSRPSLALRAGGVSIRPCGNASSTLAASSTSVSSSGGEAATDRIAKSALCSGAKPLARHKRERETSCAGRLPPKSEDHEKKSGPRRGNSASDAELGVTAPMSRSKFSPSALTSRCCGRGGAAAGSPVPSGSRPFPTAQR